MSHIPLFFWEKYFHNTFDQSPGMCEIFVFDIILSIFFKKSRDKIISNTNMSHIPLFFCKILEPSW